MMSKFCSVLLNFARLCRNLHGIHFCSIGTQVSFAQFCSILLNDVELILNDVELILNDIELILNDVSIFLNGEVGIMSLLLYPKRLWPGLEQPHEQPGGREWE